jgi:hypothetical protein
VQWTDENGAYGGDPYGAPGYGYAYGRDGSAGPAGPGHLATTPWDTPGAPSGHGDVLTASPQPGSYGFPQEPGTYAVAPEPDPSTRPAPEGDTAEGQPVRPVFVDSSGRRQRRVLRAARLLVIPAGGYVALLVSAVLGGPTVSAPFLPQPHTASPATHRVTAPEPSSRTGRPTVGASSKAASSRPRARQTTSAPAAGSAASTSPAAGAGTTAGPTATTTPTATTAAAPASSPRGHALGVSHKPVK